MMTMPARRDTSVGNKVPSATGLSLRKNFSWTFFGNAIHAVCQWGVLVVLAKLGSPEMVGQYALGLAIATPVFMFTNLQLRGIQSTDAKVVYSFIDYRSLRLAATMLGMIGIVTIALLSGYGSETTVVIILVGLTKAFESISDVYYGYAQQKERMDLVSRSMMYKGLLSLASVVLLMVITESIVWVSAGVAVAWLVRFLKYDVRFTSILGRADDIRGWDISRSISLVRIAFPLGLAMMFVSLNNNIPRYFIQHELGEKYLGFYSAVSYLMIVGTTVVSALGQSASPRLARQYADGNMAKFKLLLKKLILIGIGVGIVGVAFSYVLGGHVLSLIYTEEYASYGGVLTAFMIAALIQYCTSFLGYGMTASRHIKVQMPLFFVASVSTLICSSVLIPKYGLMGGVIALIISSIISLSGSLAVILYGLRTID